MNECFVLATEVCFMAPFSVLYRGDGFERSLAEEQNHSKLHGFIWYTRMCTDACGEQGCLYVSKVCEISMHAHGKPWSICVAG
jgi:hypothetical protein